MANPFETSASPPTDPFSRDPAGNYYWRDGTRRDLRWGDPSDGMNVEGIALTDPNSDASNSLYYGGMANAARDEMTALRDQGRSAYFRDPPILDGALAAQSRAFWNGLAARNGLSATGDPNSVAQQQLARGYNDANRAILSTAASADGGPATQALANRTAQNAIARNSQLQAIDSQQQMAREQMSSYGQLAGLGGAMRSADQDAAFATASNQMRQRGLNDAELARREAMRQQVGTLGLQGQQSRQDNRTNWLGQYYGQSTLNDAANQRNQERTENAVMGAATGAFQAAGRATEKSPKSGLAAATPKRNDEFAWSA